MSTHSSTFPLYVPIDFGKNVNWYAARTGIELEPVWLARKVHNHKQGYSLLAHDLRQAIDSAAYPSILVGYEPTGIYHEAWVQALMTDFGDQLQVRQIHPATMHARRQGLQKGRSRKSDPIDLDALCHCLRDGVASPAPQLSTGDLQFEVWTAGYEQLLVEKVRQKQRLGAQIDRLWPGMLLDVKQFAKIHPEMEVPEPLLRSRPLERGLLQAILRHCPDPHTWQAWGADQIQAFVRKHTGRCGPQTLAKIQQVLDRGLYLAPEMTKLLAERLQADFLAYQELEARLDQQEQIAEELVRNSQAAVLAGIPGMSPTLAARYKGHIGPIGRFGSAAQIWAFAGFEPTLNESGDHRSQANISQKGAPTFRDTLFLMGFHTRRHCPAIGRAYRNALGHGKGNVGAVIHAAHKVNRMCFHLYTTQQPYDPKRAG
jgi:transposase